MSAADDRRESGFTLVEVLVASLLLIVAATGVAQLVGTDRACEPSRERADDNRLSGGAKNGAAPVAFVDV